MADRLSDRQGREVRDTDARRLARSDDRAARMAKWANREVGEDKADQIIAFTQMCRVVPLDTKTALAAAEICRRHKLATADAIVYATALEHGADLLTCDAHFEGLPGVAFVAKINA